MCKPSIRNLNTACSREGSTTSSRGVIRLHASFDYRAPCSQAQQSLYLCLLGYFHRSNIFPVYQERTWPYDFLVPLTHRRITAEVCKRFAGKHKGYEGSAGSRFLKITYDDVLARQFSCSLDNERWRQGSCFDVSE